MWNRRVPPRHLPLDTHDDRVASPADGVNAAADNDTSQLKASLQDRPTQAVVAVTGAKRGLHELMIDPKDVLVDSRSDNHNHTRTKEPMNLATASGPSKRRKMDNDAPPSGQRPCKSRRPRRTAGPADRLRSDVQPRLIRVPQRIVSGEGRNRSVLHIEQERIYVE